MLLASVVLELVELAELDVALLTGAVLVGLTVTVVVPESVVTVTKFVEVLVVVPTGTVIVQVTDPATVLIVV